MQAVRSVTCTLSTYIIHETSDGFSTFQIIRSSSHPKHPHKLVALVDSHCHGTFWETTFKTLEMLSTATLMASWRPPWASKLRFGFLVTLSLIGVSITFPQKYIAPISFWHVPLAKGNCNRARFLRFISAWTCSLSASIWLKGYCWKKIKQIPCPQNKSTHSPGRGSQCYDQLTAEQHTCTR